MSIYIFLGPSLSQEHAVKLLEATYLPLSSKATSSGFLNESRSTSEL
jgi:hypothetical protein